MEELCKRIEEWRVEDEESAKALIEKAKNDAATEGYELKGYQATKKEKKSKGEIVDEWYVVKLTKVWDA